MDIRPLRGRADNEMTRFRYEAILHIGCDDAPVLDGDFQDWSEHKWTVSEIRSLLRQDANRPICFKGIRNARLEKDFVAMAILDGPDTPPTAGELRHRAAKNEGEGVHPQALLDLETEGVGFKVFLSWAACRRDGSYDACLIPAESCRVRIHRQSTGPSRMLRSLCSTQMRPDKSKCGMN